MRQHLLIVCCSDVRMCEGDVDADAMCCSYVGIATDNDLSWIRNNITSIFVCGDYHSATRS